MEPLWIGSMDGTARTNKLSQAWHGRIERLVGKDSEEPAHSVFSAFFVAFEKELDTESMLWQLEIGQKIWKGREKKNRSDKD